MEAYYTMKTLINQFSPKKTEPRPVGFWPSDAIPQWDVLNDPVYFNG